MRPVKRAWGVLGLGSDIYGRVGFAILLVSGGVTGFAYVRERSGLSTAVIVVAGLVLMVLGAVLMTRSARADERKKVEQLVDEPTSELQQKVNALQRFGVLVPVKWNAIVYGMPTDGAPEVEVVPPGCTVLMGPSDLRDDHGTSISGGIGNRAYGVGCTVVGSFNTAGPRPY